MPERFFHADGTECVAGHTDGLCAEGGGPVQACASCLNADLPGVGPCARHAGPVAFAASEVLKLRNAAMDRFARGLDLVVWEREQPPAWLAALVAVVRSLVEAGHYDNSPSGLWECPALRGGSCDCGWVEAKAALDVYETASS